MEIRSPPPVRRCELGLSSENVCNSQGNTSPAPKKKRQKVIPCSAGAVPTSARAARPLPRKKARIPTISISIADHSSRSSLCNVLSGALVKRNTKEINAVLVENADVRNIPPKSLVRDHRGTLDAASRTPV